MMYWLVAVCTLLSVAPLLWAQGSQIHRWNVRDYPDPHSYETYRQCQRGNQSNICDPNSILSKQEADEVDSLIRRVYQETRCGCRSCIEESRGYVIRVALMRRMERILNLGNDTHAMLLDARQYAYTLSRRWMMGGSCNESLLILFSKYDGILYTLTLPHARVRLNDQLVKRVTLSVRPFFDREETIGEGLKEMIRRYKLALEGMEEEALRPQASAQKRESDASRFSPPIFLSVMLFLVTSVFIQ